MGLLAAEALGAEGRLVRPVEGALVGLRGLGGDEGQRLLDGLWDGRRGGQMGAFRVETVLVGHVADGIVHSIGAGVREGSLRVHRLQVLVAGVLQVAALLGGDSIPGLITATKLHERSTSNNKREITNQFNFKTHFGAVIGVNVFCYLWVEEINKKVLHSLESKYRYLRRHNSMTLVENYRNCSNRKLDFMLQLIVTN